jgi:hypothetical protein
MFSATISFLFRNCYIQKKISHGHVSDYTDISVAYISNFLVKHIGMLVVRINSMSITSLFSMSKAMRTSSYMLLPCYNFCIIVAFPSILSPGMLRTAEVLTRIRRTVVNSPSAASPLWMITSHVVIKLVRPRISKASGK